MWTKVKFFDSDVFAWQCPDDLLNAFGLAQPNDDTLVWAQVGDDSPWRLFKKA